MSADDISEYYVADRKEIVEFLGGQGTSWASTLDIGCASGALGRELLRTGLTAACDGIELNAEAAAIARGHLRQVWSGSLEAVADRVPWQQYELVMMADVLEHLADPWEALLFLHRETAPGCRLMLSVPNVRHYKVVLPLLLKGEFRYTDQGIMDRTHLHFFTRGSLAEMLAECGWAIRGPMVPHMKSRFRRWYVPTRLVEPFVAVQYMLMAEKR